MDGQTFIKMKKINESLTEITFKYTINSNHIFADNAARDAYFTAHPTELVEGLFISVGAGFQHRENSAWADKTSLLQGPKGDTGAQGSQGPQGIQGAKGDTGAQGNPGVNNSVVDSNTGTGVSNIKLYTCTQAEYDAIGTKDPATLYFIKS